MDEFQNPSPSAENANVYLPQRERYFSSNFQNKNQQSPYYRQNQNRNNYNQNKNYNHNNQKNRHYQNNFRNNNNGQGRYFQQSSSTGGFNQQNNRNNFHNNRVKGRYNQQNTEIDINKYIHRSMTEDPWKYLLERHYALTGDENDNKEDESIHKDEENFEIENDEKIDD